ncbi:hypothetical protein ANABIO32_02660 [Rossellomorea marisflavi]|jgi:hypothetical protein|uniref:hypothetical protein n=1 Tax=Rossellomorea marisflavi TaxID=189381 RepID=UPI0025CAD82F|nr:hypothetical protein [Rossellomorea marisflavi]GLI82579.1 hypothetical protein ANABIO32_02660 [Rossellomorea marisflavi]
MKLGTRKVFKNVTSEVVFNPVKKFTAFLVEDGEIKPKVFEGKFRTQVLRDVNQYAKENQVKFDGKLYPLT